MQNRLLAALPAADYGRLLRDLEFLPFPLDWVVYESGDPQGYVYFPTTSIVSLPQARQDGAPGAVAVIGNEGMIGTAMFTGGESASRRAVVLKEGCAFRLNGSLVKDEIARGGPLQRLLRNYMLALNAQAAQTAVCNTNHPVEQQLCRWLLSISDRLPSKELPVTQTLIASTLGVRSESVGDAAGKLQAAGMIHISYGRISVLDRPQLESRVCECYALVKRETERLFPAKII